MALDDLIRNGVALADSILGEGNLLPKVRHEAWDGATRDKQGRPTLSAAVSRSALVEDVDEEVVDTNGNKVRAKTKVTFLRLVTVRTEDRITLPDLRTGKILTVNRGVLDKQGRPFLVEVYF